MNRILCSTGALIGMPNGRNYRLLEEVSGKLACDGYEFMMYSSWYEETDRLIETVRGMKLCIPVVHCQKTLGELLSGLQVTDARVVVPVDEEEDRFRFAKAKEEFRINLHLAGEFGADRMVLHLWNGMPSDRNIQKNIERFGELRDMAERQGVDLMVENVVCNYRDPLYNLGLLHKAYPTASVIYDTKMAEFHGQTMALFEKEWDWILREKRLHHLHINDYGGGYLDWGNLQVLPLGKGHVDFESFFRELKKYGYEGDYTVEATAFDRTTGEIDCEMLNHCFRDLRLLAGAGSPAGQKVPTGAGSPIGQKVPTGQRSQENREAVLGGAE